MPSLLAELSEPSVMTPLLPSQSLVFIAALAMSRYLVASFSMSNMNAQLSFLQLSPLRITSHIRQHTQPFDVLAAIVGEEPSRWRPAAVFCVDSVQNDRLRIEVQILNPGRGSDSGVGVGGVSCGFGQIRREAARD